MREYLLCMVTAAAVTFLFTPVARLVALRIGALAEVRDRDVHDTATPRLGGLAMLFGFGASMLLASQLPLLSSVFDDHSTVFALAAGCLLISALGVVDDRYGLDAPTKFAGQVLAAGVMAVLGVQLVWLPIGGVLALDNTTSIVLTVFVIVLTINAVNFVDGLDGLAAGIVGIGAVAFFGYSYVLSVQNGFDRATLATLISALLAGMCIGFLPHNFFPARIFMGDTGSMLIGLLLATSAITLTGQVDPTAIDGEHLVPALLPLILPFAVMAVPLVDVLLAVVRRTRAGRSPFSPDKQHLHHRLLTLGHSQRAAVVLMYAWTALVAFGAVAIAVLPWEWSAALIGVLLVVVLGFTVSLPRLRETWNRVRTPAES
jgi:UDP-GlcNAc:undecaprenyl-phosphate/decaprenyl-phosphate GlcNAc-1-phosphate transferase